MFLPGFLGRAPPAEISFEAAAAINSTLTVYTFVGVNIGAAHPSRRVIVAAEVPGPFGGTITSVTINGVATTSHVQASAGTGIANDTIVDISSLKVPSGTTATIVVTVSGASSACEIGVHRLINESMAAPYATMSDNALAGAVLSGTINIPDRGVLVAGALFLSATAGNSWTGVTEDYDQTPTANFQATGASDDALATQVGRTVTVTNAGAPNRGTLCAVSWG